MGTGKSTRFAHSGEVKAFGKPNCDLLVRSTHKKDKPFSKAWGNRTRAEGFKIKEGRFRPGLRKKFFIMIMVRHWSWLPRERWWMPHPWKYSKSGWMGFHAIWSSWSCLLQDCWTKRSLNVSSNPNCYITLWNTGIQSRIAVSLMFSIQRGPPSWLTFSFSG